MACFIVPTAEAAIVTIVAYAIKNREAKKGRIALGNNHSNAAVSAAEKTGISFSTKLMWLARLLFGGAFLLAYEHVWHGEVVPWFPFLTAASNPADTAQMLKEMSTVGVSMAVLVTLVWVGIILVTNIMAKRALKTQAVTA